eukprot:SAG22_NODE_23_length_31399_cov_35.631313_17_plen_56_part_00
MLQVLQSNRTVWRTSLKGTRVWYSTSVQMLSRCLHRALEARSLAHPAEHIRSDTL